VKHLNKFRSALKYVICFAFDRWVRRTNEELAKAKYSCRFVFSMPLALFIMGQSVALERPLPLLGVQRLSTLFNVLQRLSTPALLAVLKRSEHLSAVTFRTSLEGRSTRSVGRESLGLKRSVRVQAFTCRS
jgi:hypothetical protein